MDVCSVSSGSDSNMISNKRLHSDENNDGIVLFTCNLNYAAFSK